VGSYLGRICSTAYNRKPDDGAEFSSNSNPEGRDFRAEDTARAALRPSVGLLPEQERPCLAVPLDDPPTELPAGALPTAGEPSRSTRDLFSEFPPRGEANDMCVLTSDFRAWSRQAPSARPPTALLTGPSGEHADLATLDFFGSRPPTAASFSSRPEGLPFPETRSSSPADPGTKQTLIVGRRRTPPSAEL